MIEPRIMILAMIVTHLMVGLRGRKAVVFIAI
jgi:hypothetical protein